MVRDFMNTLVYNLKYLISRYIDLKLCKIFMNPGSLKKINNMHIVINLRANLHDYSGSSATKKAPFYSVEIRP